MKYSLLVCAYNAQKYLKECLDSLVNQSISKLKYEIILVNDGSTDFTERIASNYKGIKIINQKNMGLSAARNTAVENSRGEWLIFIDSDDYVSNNLLKTIDDVDKKDKNFIIYKEIKDIKAEKEDKKRQSNKIDDSIISRVIHRDLFNWYSFPSKYRYAIEDWDFYVHNYDKLNILDITNKKEVFYFYRFNANSLSKAHRVYRSRLTHAISIFEDKELRNKNLNQEIIGHYYEHLYMMARLWFPDLLDRVKSIKFKTKISFFIKLQYQIVRLGVFNFLIRKSVKKINK